MSKNKLFISHAAKDQALVDALVDLLATGTTLNTSAVEYSSLKGKGVASGDDFATYIKSHVHQPEVSIIILSPNYFANRLCLCEMGALLASARSVVPLLVAPLPMEHVTGIFADAAVMDISSTDDLNKLVALLDQHLEHVSLHLSRWAVKKKQFLADLPALL